MKSKLVLFLIFFFVAGLFAFAQQKADSTAVKKSPCGKCVYDKNKNGVCDNLENKTKTPCSFVDKNNDGICDLHGKDNCCPKGKNFVDKNKDGVCDHRVANPPCPAHQPPKKD